LNHLHLQPKSESETPVRETTKLPETRAYRELPGVTNETRDVLKQLDANIQLLEDMNGRLSFVLSEVRGLLRR